MATVSYLPPPQGCARLEAIASACGGELTRVAGAATIEYALPAEARDDVRNYLRACARAEIPARDSALLPGGRVYGSGIILSPDGRWVARDVSEDFGRSFEEHWLLKHRRIRPAQFVRGKTAVVATTLGSGYSHWLLEELPRLLTVGPNECTAVIASVRESWARDAFKLHGFRGEILPAKREAHWQCEQLLVPSLVAPAGHPTAEVVARIREFAGGIREDGAALAGGGRIYVSREKARRRRVANEVALWRALEARGFQKVFLEELGWAEQIRLFRGTRMVVAPHGAGLANLVFCVQGTRVVECLSRAYFNPCYWRLSVVAGLDYRAVVADGGGEIGMDLRANRDDIEADVAQVCAALE